MALNLLRSGIGGESVSVMVKDIFDDYRFKMKNLTFVKGELEKVNKKINIKSSAINPDATISLKDTCDRYNDLIERKMRLEATVSEYEDSISLIDNVLNLMNSDYPVECLALKMRHIECKTLFQMQERLNFSRGQCWNYLKRGEKEMENLLKIVS